MSILHLHIGLYALATGDVNDAEIEFNIALDLLRVNSTSSNTHLVRVRLARTELCRQSPASCLALIRSAESFSIPLDIAFAIQFLRADLCLFIRDLDMAITPTILSLAFARILSDGSRVAAVVQRLGDLFLMADKIFQSATACYQRTLEVMRNAGARQHVADCVLRLGIVLLLEGQVAEAKRKLTNSRRIYKLAEDAQGYGYCECILAECEVEGQKVI